MNRSCLLLFAFGCTLSGAITVGAQSNYEPYSFTTFAGIAAGNVDGAGSAARFNLPNGVAVDGAGNVYVADRYNFTIRKITSSGVVSTLAGRPGSSGSNDGIGSAARFSLPDDVAVDSAGIVYVADTFNNRIRKITPCGAVSTLLDSNGGVATFSYPDGVAVDSAGNVYVHSGDFTIYKITPSGAVSTVTDGAIGKGVTVDGAGNVYVSDGFAVRKITSEGVVSTLAGLADTNGSDDGVGSAARFYSPQGLAVDSAGNVYVADSSNFLGNSTIRKITPSGAVTTLAGLARNYGSEDGTGSAARFNFPNDVAVDSAGNVYVADTENNTIRKITSAGVVTTLAGLPGGTGNVDGSAPRFFLPYSVAVDSAGNVYVADTGNLTIRKVLPSRVVSTLAGSGGAGSEDGTGSAASFYNPGGLAVDSGGTVYVADTFNNTIRKITPSGVVTTFAGLAGSTGSADGTGNAARFNQPSGVAVDSVGNVYVADQLNSTIRKITSSAEVTTFAGLAGTTGSEDGTGSAARFNEPAGVAVDTGANIYVADTRNGTIRRITSAGVVSTLAGSPGSFGSADGTGSAARFNVPKGVAVDSAGNVYVADSDAYYDTSNNTIRKVTPAGIVRTLAGLARSVDIYDGTGSAARFSYPNGLAVDSAGSVYVADTGNSTIRLGVNAAPVITTVGQRFVYQIEITNTGLVGVSNLPPGLSFDAQLAAIVGVPTAAGTFQVTISVGAVHSTLTVTVQPAPASGPVISSSTSATGSAGRPFNFQVYTTGGTPATRLSASGLPPGLSADPVSGIISGSATAKGSSIVMLTVTDGAITAVATLQLTFTADPTLPVIISSGTAFLVPGQFFTYTINVQAACDEVTTLALLGTLPTGLTFNGIETISGIYSGPLGANANSRPHKPELAGGTLLGSIQLFGTNSHGTATFQLLFLAAPSGAVNVSTRLLVGTGQNVLIGGFIITGDAPKVVLVRAIGPSTGIPGALPDPTLELHDSANHVVYNDNWNDSQGSLIVATAAAPTDNLESAIVIGLDPGPYTAIVAGKDGATGIALVEVYDLGTAILGSFGDSKLANISTRGFVDTGDNVMIGGFIIRGQATRVIARAIGPSLSGAGVSGGLQDPILQLKNSDGMTLVTNDDWQQAPPADIQEIQKFGLTPTDTRESALITTLPPGAYTGIVRGKDGTTGVGLVEIYSLQ
jgi:sugar lactone lactonase YvrE